MRHFKHEINPELINEEIKLIKETNRYYISENGNLYKRLSNGYLQKMNLKANNTGYVYCGITDKNGKRLTRRVHKLVALYFVKNEDPDKNIIVGHKDNIKTNNVKDNLYWTTISENTQKAFDDGLIENDKGYNDSQSYEIFVYKNKKLFKTYGSVKECIKEMKKDYDWINQTTVLRRAHKNRETKDNYKKYRKFKEWDFFFEKQ